MSFYFNNIALEVYFDERDAWSVIKYIKTSSWSVWLIDATFYAMQVFSALLKTPPFPTTCTLLAQHEPEVYEKVRIITPDQLCPYLSPCNPSVHLSLFLHITVRKNVKTFPLFLAYATTYSSLNKQNNMEDIIICVSMLSLFHNFSCIYLDSSLCRASL